MYLFTKRFLDIVISIIGIIFLIPICLVIKFLYILDGDFASIFYVQKRVGKNGKIFKLYKFRTMVVNAEKILSELLNDTNIRLEYESSYKLKNDPRLTRFGKILRVLSIDEFPQFINVFIGNMSIVGPRPVIPPELEKYGKKKNLILSVKPGLTGYWVVKGRSNVAYKERVKFEAYYVKHANIFLDAFIFFKTIILVFIGRGAA